MSKTNSMNAKLRRYPSHNRDTNNKWDPSIDGITRNRRDVDGSTIPAKEKTLTTAGMLKNSRDISHSRETSNSRDSGDCRLWK
jgi:hypothetical protein